MIEAAEYDGRLKPGGTVIEANRRQYRIGPRPLLARARETIGTILVVPDKMSREKDFACAGDERGDHR